jgi:S-adenosylmethionine:tRNA ribosyltransferase-isomerase
MDLKDFEYNLPKELIAQDPLKKRDESRLLVIDKKTGEFSHHIFKEIIDYLEPGDTLVLNETKVIPARLIGSLVKENSIVGASPCEVFLLKRITDTTWECLVRPGKKLRIGARVSFGDGKLTCEVKDILPDGNRIVEFFYEGIFEEILDALGEMPLPPYITHKLEDKDRYQTVYAKNEGSVAAPTAGLHFTKELLSKIEDKGVNIAYVTLHVSLGTFRPVHVEKIEEHEMHTERFFIPKDAVDKVNVAKLSGKKVICVGTTSIRSLESAAYYDEDKKCYLLKECDGETNIFIYPGYKYKLADSLITNFHLPGSTLIMLVSAFSSLPIVMNAYKEAIKEKYRFYSFGDACFFYDKTK